MEQYIQTMTDTLQNHFPEVDETQIEDAVADITEAIELQSLVFIQK